MNAKTNQQLTNEIAVLRDLYNGLVAELETLKVKVDSKPKLSDLTRVETILDAKIADNAGDIVRLDRKLTHVVLPEEPRYYLTQDEITSFQANLSKLLAMMTSFEQLYQNLVAYSANLS